MTISNHSKNKGFTLIETLVAIAILLTAVVGPISLIGDAMHKMYYAKDEMIAINLAQEGIEVVRAKRDSNMLNGGVPWDDEITGGDYIVDSSSVPPTVTAGAYSGVKQPVYLDNGFYKQGSFVEATQFTRLVTITSVVAGKESKVTSTVEWKTGGQAGTITVTENLFRWAIL